MSSEKHQILAAVQELRFAGRDLTPSQYEPLLDAIEQATQALHSAPTGADPVATGLWWNHERAPALARIADVLSAATGRHRSVSATAELHQQQLSDRAALLALRDALLHSAPR